jgi:hypothetical protein
VNSSSGFSPKKPPNTVSRSFPCLNSLKDPFDPAIYRGVSGEILQRSFKRGPPRDYDLG